MQISEISSSDAGAGESNNHEGEAAQRIEKLVSDVENAVPLIKPDTVQQLRDSLSLLVPVQMSENLRLCLWKLSYRIWNACVGMANNALPGQDVDEEHAKLRHVASDMLLLAGSIDTVRSSHLKMAMFFYRTGLIWHKLSNYGMASLCFEKAMELSCKPKEDQGADSLSLSDRKEEDQFMFDLYVARAKTAWNLSQKALACSLLGRARGLLSVLPESRQDLAEQYLQNAKYLLAEPEKQSQTESIKYMEHAIEICSEANISNGREILGGGPLGCLRIKILRYLAAGHLQNENFENALKCVAILRGVPDHPSTAFLALKALAGLNRFEEAEKELYALLGHNGTPVEVCISAIEILAQGTEELDAVKKAFFILQSRYPTNKELAVRILEKLLRRQASTASNHEHKK
eukprot:c4803_g1_i1 orf=134-1345(+)